MIRNFISTEFAKLRQMSFAEKRQYLWEYYRLHLLFTAVVVFMVGSLINVWLINPPKRDYLYIAWQANPVHIETLNEMAEKLNVIVYNPNRYHVSVRSYVLGHDPQVNQAIITRFHALLTVGDIHAMLTTYQGVQEAAGIQMIRSTEGVLDILRESNPPLYEIISERLLTVTYITLDDEIEITDTMAICMSGAPMLESLGIDTSDLFMGVVAPRHFNEIASALAVMFEVY